MSDKQKTENVLSITVLASPSVLTFIKQETLRYDDQGLETGGILVGIWLDPDTCYLVGATGSGPMAEHAQYSFAVDTDYANNELNRIRQSFPGSDYVGEWHKHPATLERPSQGDLMTARQLLADPDYPIRLINPIMTVKQHQANFHLFYLDRDLPDFVRLQEHGHIEAETDNEPWDDGSSIYHANIVLVAKNKRPQAAAPAPVPVIPVNPAIKPAQPRPQPAPPALLDIPSPFTGEAGDIKVDTVKKYSKYFDNVPPARLSSTYNEGAARPKEFFETQPPARLSPNYSWNDNPVAPPRMPPPPGATSTTSPRPYTPGPMPGQVPTGKLSGNQRPPVDDDDTIAMGGAGEDDTVAMNNLDPQKTATLRQPGPPAPGPVPPISQPKVGGQASQPYAGMQPQTPPLSGYAPSMNPVPAKKAGISPALVMLLVALLVLLVIVLGVFFLTR